MTDSKIKQNAKQLRSNQTDCEQKLWAHLRARRFENKKFYRQFVIGPYIVDFVQRQCKVVIELDGGQHSENKQQDDNRTKYLESLGYQVIRYWNNEIIENFDGVLSDISNTLSIRERQMDPLEIPTASLEFAQRRAYRNNSDCSNIWDILDSVCDPELPGLTIWDLGILQDVKIDEVDSIDPQIEVVVTPTYSGCPAVDTIINDITKALNQSGYSQVKVKVTLSPAWTTEMMSPAGKAHLKSIHIAPPHQDDVVECPVCDSNNIKLISQFGSTACKSLHQCNDCSEVFDYFKHF